MRDFTKLVLDTHDAYIRRDWQHIAKLLGAEIIGHQITCSIYEPPPRSRLAQVPCDVYYLIFYHISEHCVHEYVHKYFRYVLPVIKNPRRYIQLYHMMYGHTSISFQLTAAIQYRIPYSELQRVSAEIDAPSPDWMPTIAVNNLLSDISTGDIKASYDLHLNMNCDLPEYKWREVVNTLNAYTVGDNMIHPPKQRGGLRIGSMRMTDLMRIANGTNCVVDVSHSRSNRLFGWERMRNDRDSEEYIGTGTSRMSRLLSYRLVNSRCTEWPEEYRVINNLPDALSATDIAAIDFCDATGMLRYRGYDDFGYYKGDDESPIDFEDIIDTYYYYRENYYHNWYSPFWSATHCRNCAAHEVPIEDESRCIYTEYPCKFDAATCHEYCCDVTQDTLSALDNTACDWYQIMRV